MNASTPSALVVLIGVASLAARAQAQPNPKASDESPQPAEIPMLRVATKEAPPFSLNEAGSWTGLTHALLSRVAELEGFEYTLVPMGIEEMIDATASGEVDLAAAALTITAEREARVEFTHPILSSGLGMAVPPHAGLTVGGLLEGFFSLSFLEAAGALLLVLFVVGSAVWLVERRANSSQFPESPLRGLGAGLWWSATTMTTVGYGDKAPITPAGRVLGLIWMFASVILISSFTAAIATSLTVGELESRIHDVDDLSGRRVVTVEGSAASSFLAARGLAHRTAPNIEDVVRAVADERADVAVYDLPILRYLARQSPGELDILPGRLARQSYGLALPPESPLRKRFNKRILEITHSSDWEALLMRYMGTVD